MIINHNNKTGDNDYNPSNVPEGTITDQLDTLAEHANCVTDDMQTLETVSLEVTCSAYVATFLMIKRYSVTVHAVAIFATVPILFVMVLSSERELHVYVLVGGGVAYSYAQTYSIKPCTDSDDTPVVSYDSAATSLVVTHDNVLRFISNDISLVPIIVKHFVDSGVTHTLPVRMGDLWEGREEEEGLVEVSQAELEAVGGILDGGIMYNLISPVLSVTVALSDKVYALVAEVGADKTIVLAVTSGNITDLLNSANDNPDGAIWAGSIFVQSKNITSDEIPSQFAEVTDMTAIGFTIPTMQETPDKMYDTLGRLSNAYTLNVPDAIWALVLFMETADANLVTDETSPIPDDYSGALGIALDGAGDLANIIYELWGRYCRW